MRGGVVLGLLVFAACSEQPAQELAAGPVEATTVARPTGAPDRGPPSTLRRDYRYTSLEDCQLVREEQKEMPYSEVLCAGPAGWALRIADSDARQTLSVVSPGGEETKLDLSQASGGAFNSLGPTAEWRGPADEAFRPDSMIVRFSVAEQPPPAPEVSYLLAIQLVPSPCLLARVAPGPDQNDRARAAAEPHDRNGCAS